MPSSLSPRGTRRLPVISRIGKRDRNAGGARYNNTFIQMVGIGSITDSLSALKETVFESRAMTLLRLIQVLGRDFENEEVLRQRLVNRTHKYGNDDDYADDIMRMVFAACFEEIDGRPDARGGRYRVEMLPTTSHVYFGSVTGAMPDGRKAGLPLSEGISPVQGADRRGPTAVIKSAARMDHVKTGGTLLNMKFSPGLVATDDGIDKWAHLVRSYFKMDGHHIQFNVVTAETLRQAQANPEQPRDLIVRVAGYSDYFCDLSSELQEEIIARTEHQGF
jgi:formate C-acetyltransferase